MPTFFLPPATNGRHADFLEGFAGRNGQCTIIVAQPGETIIVSGTPVSQIESPSVLAGGLEGSNYIGLACIVDGTWKVTTIVGTWILTP